MFALALVVAAGLQECCVESSIVFVRNREGRERVTSSESISEKQPSAFYILRVDGFPKVTRERKCATTRVPGSGRV
jgi:hypothetical protein